MRAPKIPPRLSFIASIAISCGFARGGATTPAKITDCSAPGLSIKYTVDFAATETVFTSFAGAFPLFHPAKSFSSFGFNSASVVSPTTISVELFGWNHVS